jgi:hypothetical protein
MMALRVSLCRGNMHAPAQPLHLPLQVCRRELLATAHPEANVYRDNGTPRLRPGHQVSKVLSASSRNRLSNGIGVLPAFQVPDI